MERRIAARFGVWLAALVMSAALQGSAVHADEISQILRGYEIITEIFPKGTKLSFGGTDWALVGLGSYLVNSTGCNDCHTHPNWRLTTTRIWGSRNRSIPMCTFPVVASLGRSPRQSRSPPISRRTKKLADQRD